MRTTEQWGPAKLSHQNINTEESDGPTDRAGYMISRLDIQCMYHKPMTKLALSKQSLLLQGGCQCLEDCKNKVISSHPN